MGSAKARNAWGLVFAGLTAAFLVGCATGTDYSSRLKSAELRSRAEALSDRMLDAAAIMMAYAQSVPDGDMYQFIALQQVAEYYAAAGRRGDAMGALNRCVGAAPKDGHARNMQGLCRSQQSAYLSGKYPTREELKVTINKRFKIENEMDEEFEREMAANRPAPISPIVPPLVLTPPGRPAQPGYAPQMNQPLTPARVPPQLVNECISIRFNERGVRNLYNGCAFTVQVSWCVEDPEASAACRNGANGTMSDSIGAGKDTVSFLGKTGRVFWTACKGGLGVLPSLKQGHSSCS